MVIYDVNWNALTCSPDLSKGHLEVRVYSYDDVQYLAKEADKKARRKNKESDAITETIHREEERLVYVEGVPQAKSDAEERMEILENAVLELAELLGGE